MDAYAITIDKRQRGISRLHTCVIIFNVIDTFLNLQLDGLMKLRFQISSSYLL